MKNTYHILRNMYIFCNLARTLVPKLTATACDNTTAAYIPLTNHHEDRHIAKRTRTDWLEFFVGFRVCLVSGNTNCCHNLYCASPIYGSYPPRHQNQTAERMEIVLPTPVMFWIVFASAYVRTGYPTQRWDLQPTIHARKLRQRGEASEWVQ